jgi:hypothetical protein
MTILAIPDEVFAHLIFPHWTIAERYLFSRGCKATYELVQYIGKCYSHEDVTLAGDRITIAPEDKAHIPLNEVVSRYFRHLFKMAILARHPEILEHIKKARNSVKAKNGNPDDIAVLLADHVFENQQEFLPYLTIFDFDSKKISSKTLATSVAKFAINIANLDLVRAALFYHPNAMNIAPLFLGEVLQHTIYKNDKNKLELIKLIFSHPNASEISRAILKNCLRRETSQGTRDGDPEIIKELLSHRNAPKTLEEALSLTPSSGPVSTPKPKRKRKGNNCKMQ